MPYLPIDERRRFTVLLEEFYKCNNFRPLSEGELNYIISKMIWHIFDTIPRYKTLNLLLGVLEGVKQEFYRRKGATLEDVKIIENGDL